MKTFLLFCLCSLFSYTEQNSTENTIVLDVYNTSNATLIRTDTISVDSALVRWRTDSLGCFQQRTIVLAQELMEKLKIMGKRHNEVIQILGKPNTAYYQDIYVGNIQKDGTFLVLGYYIEQQCIGGKIVEKETTHNMVYLTIDLETNTVVSSSF